MHEWLTGFGVSTFLSVLPVLNPPEGIPVFVALTSGQSREYRLRMAKETAIYVLAIMVISLLAVRAVLAFFGVAVGHLQVAGGLIVAKTAWEMSTGSVSVPHRARKRRAPRRTSPSRRWRCRYSAGPASSPS